MAGIVPRLIGAGALACCLLAGPTPLHADTTRPGWIVFSYWKNVHEESETAGGKGGVGADRTLDDVTIEVSGRVDLDLPTADFDYLEPTVTVPTGPSQTFTLPNPQSFFARWPEEERVSGRPRAAAYAVRGNVTGNRDHQHFAMNAWGPPSPKWIHQPKMSIQGHCSSQGGSAPGAVNPQDVTKPLGGVSFMAQDVEATFTFSFQMACPTQEKLTWTYVDKTPDRHEDRDDFEALQVELPAGGKDDWTRNIKRLPSGLVVTASRITPAGDASPPRKGERVHRVEERLSISIGLRSAQPCLRVPGNAPCPDPSGGCACPDGTSCQPDIAESSGGGRCCPEGMVACREVCVPDTPENRRACRCGEGDANYCAGSCCAPGQSCCDDRCAKTESDPQNCGACGKACPQGQSCCGGRCVDLSSDAANCGRCGNLCPGGEAYYGSPSSGEPGGSGYLFYGVCNAGLCERKKVECSVPNPVPCYSTPQGGGPGCVQTEAQCMDPDWQNLGRGPGPK